MADSVSPVCFHCGQTTESSEDGPRLNRLNDGRPCPVCADRLLEMLPSLVTEVARDIAEVEADPSALGDDAQFPDEPA